MQRGWCVSITQFGGEPHYKCAVSRFGKALSRESLKHIFAAAARWRGAIELSSIATRGTCLRPRASRLSERHIFNGWWRRHAIVLKAQNATHSSVSVVMRHLFRHCSPTYRLFRGRSPSSISFQKPVLCSNCSSSANGSFDRKRKSPIVFLCRTRWTRMPSAVRAK